MIEKVSTTKSHIKKRLLLCSAFAVPLLLTSGISNQAQQSICQDASLSNQAISQCLANAGANNSWLAWFTGKSRSTQYQLIDLLLAQKPIQLFLDSLNQSKRQFYFLKIDRSLKSCKMFYC